MAPPTSYTTSTNIKVQMLNLIFNPLHYENLN